ncbi:MAG: methionine--tRNA ligase [Patescibacteria group bacterium]
MNKFYITTPIYYANAKPHIGHSYTTIAADVIARYNRMRGRDVFFLTGMDEHGTKIFQAAQKQKKELQVFCDEISAYFKSLWDSFSISYDDFIRTTEKRHKNGVLIFLEKLKKAGVIYKGKYEGLYCDGCEKFLTEKELVGGRCQYHQKPPKKISEKNYFFKLSKFLPKVKNLIENDEIKILPENEKKEVLGLFKQNLEDFSISREKVKWGIKFPYNKNQVTYVWVDALSNYITALGYDRAENFKKFWPADLHLIGRDILKFHAVFWPAMLYACGEKLPKNLFVHGFFTVNGQKMSKSLGNVIDPNEMIKKYSSDGARYLIISQFPFGQDGDINAGRFDEKYNADLANNLGNLAARVTKLSEKTKNQKPKTKTTNQKLEKLVLKNWEKYEKLLNIFKIDEALDVIYIIINFINKYIDDIKPWELQKKDPEKFERAMFDLLEVLRHIGWMLNPYLPETSKKILEQLGVWEREKTREFEEIKKWKTEIDINKIKKGEILFPRI